jgi:3-phosphoshikimate 1-carboxyvinyltransferase
MLCAGAGGWQVEVLGNNAEESPYVRMTSELIRVFPKGGGTFQVEPDASSGSYFRAVSKFVQLPQYLEYSAQFGVPVTTVQLDPIRVANWPTSGWQADQKFSEVIFQAEGLDLGLDYQRCSPPTEQDLEKLRQMAGDAVISRARDLGDSIMTAIVLAPFSISPVRFTDLGRLRVQECERVLALRTELTKCGAKVVEEGDTLIVHPSSLHGAEIETYNDHRMAMCFAILGLKVPGIKIKNPSCVKKTFPNFFQKLAAPPPGGLGAQILDAKSGRVLSVDELFAE